MKANEWISLNFAKDVEIIDLTNLPGVGELTIENYPNLLEIKKSEKDQNDQYIDIRGIKRIAIINCPSLEKIEINGFRDNEELILEKLPSLKIFHCRSNRVKELDFNQCSSLEKINCGRNQIEVLRLDNCPNIKEIYCFNNRLKDLSWINNLNKEKLEGLGLENNRIPKLNISCFDRFSKLKFLYLGNDQWKRKSKDYNQFFGSLESLWPLKDLEMLSIHGTAICGGQHYLPAKLNALRCTNNNCPEIYWKLRNYSSLEHGDYYFEFNTWRQDRKLIFREKFSAMLEQERHKSN